MKVLLVNGSPHEKGCTYTALSAVAEELAKANLDTEIFHVGTTVANCLGCGYCAKTKSGKCVINDSVNVFLEKAATADGFVFGSPVYFASASGSINSFLDRVFYVGRNTLFPFKPAACVVSCRRAGATAALDNLNKYVTISQMPLVTGRYWSMVHGNTPDEVKQDLEGMQVMRDLGKNMAWMLANIQAGKSAGVVKPEFEKSIRTNFIR